MIRFLTLGIGLISLTTWSQGLNVELGINVLQSQTTNAIAVVDEFTYISYDVISDNGYGPQIEKIDTNGNILWSNFVNAGWNQPFVHELESASDGGVYVSGTTMAGCDVSSDPHFFMQKIDVSGNIEWTNDCNKFDGDIGSKGFSLIDDTLLMASGPVYWMDSTKIIMCNTDGTNLDSLTIDFVDLAGFQKLQTNSFIAYDPTSIYEFAWNGSVLQTISLPNIIDWKKRNDSLFVLTDAQLIVYDNNLAQVYTQNVTLADLDAKLRLRTTDVQVAHITSSHVEVMTFDGSLNLQGTFTYNGQMHTNELYEFNDLHMSSFANIALTSHHGIRYRDFSNIDPTDAFVNTSDVGIVALEVNDMIAYPSSIPVPGWYNIHCYITACVKNYGPNPVSSVRINRQKQQWLCGHPYYTQEYSGFTINPGDSLWIDCGWTGQEQHYIPSGDPLLAEYCFFTSHPNKITDLTVPNDEFCDFITVGYLGVDENETINVSLYPNPSNGTFNLQLSHKIEGIIQITDMTGRIISEQSILSENENIDLNSVADGTYIITILDAKEQLVYTDKLQILR